MMSVAEASGSEIDDDDSSSVANEIILATTSFLEIPANSLRFSIDHALRKNEIIPDILQHIPENVLYVIYPNAVAVGMGNYLKPTDVKHKPHIEWEAEINAFYAIIMVDLDVPSRKNPILREYCNWLVGNIPACNINKGEVLYDYVGAAPSRDSGYHRYVFLLYKQAHKIDFMEEHIGSNSDKNRKKFKSMKFAHKHKLGNVLSLNFFQAKYDSYVPTIVRQLMGEK